jgi:hypothetical protein
MYLLQLNNSDQRKIAGAHCGINEAHQPGYGSVASTTTPHSHRKNTRK